MICFANRFGYSVVSAWVGVVDSTRIGQSWLTAFRPILTSLRSNIKRGVTSSSPFSEIQSIAISANLDTCKEEPRGKRFVTLSG